MVGDIIMPSSAGYRRGRFHQHLFHAERTAPAGRSGRCSQGRRRAAYGNFLTIVVNFVIIAFVLFLVIKAINRMKKKEEAAPPPVAEVPADVKLLGENSRPAQEPIDFGPSSAARDLDATGIRIASGPRSYCGRTRVRPAAALPGWGRSSAFSMIYSRIDRSRWFRLNRPLDLSECPGRMDGPGNRLWRLSP